MFLDGSPQGRTAWMRTPYLPETPDIEKVQADALPRTRAAKEDYCGYNTLEDSQVKENILKAELEDMQLLAHCNGDRAAEQYMDMLETVYRELGNGNRRKPGFYRGDIRPVMIHAQLLGPDQLERVKKTGNHSLLFPGPCIPLGGHPRTQFWSGEGGTHQPGCIGPEGGHLFHSAPGQPGYYAGHDGDSVVRRKPAFQGG